MRLIPFGLLLAIGWQDLLHGQSVDIEAAPISYSQTADQNQVSDLIAKLKDGEVSLEYARGQGYLRSLLKVLDVPVESQVLVFSKTSLQVQHISKRNPRAIYFNDNVYVAWIRGSSMMEISSIDPKLGAAFYALQMDPAKPVIARENYNCLACHISSMTQGVPGHTVRSVFPDFDGKIDVQKQSFVTDHQSPISERWGGWYVTGRHGDMQHMGNAVLRGSRFDTSRSANLLNLYDEIDTQDWPLPYSDIVALMVLEHQTQMHNHFTRASFAVRRASYEVDQAREVSSASEALADQQELELTIARHAKEVVDYMLFCEEARLDSAVKGSKAFADGFAARGPRDQQGRSLREFDLQSRLFKYPCSYLIYSPAFAALPDALRSQIIVQLLDVLSGRNQSPAYSHLSAEVRRAILDILRDTLPEVRRADQGYPT